MLKEQVSIIKLQVSAYKIPTDFPESDGTLQWNETCLILVELEGGGKSGIGYTYADPCTAVFIEKKLRKYVIGADIFEIPALFQAMVSSIRNDGDYGIAKMAVSAVDSAAWDLKAKILNLPLAALLGMVRSDFVLYGSGGFTSYPIKRLQQQLGAWSDNGIHQVKMKIGRDPEKDILRVRSAREAIGETTQLFVDANGAYNVKQAIMMATHFFDYGVDWFEEPVPSDDLEGLKIIRDRVPPGICVTAGEYGYSLSYFEKMLRAGAVDILQADATRCGGISGFLEAGNLCKAYHLRFSSHGAPSLHFQAALSLSAFYTGEYFHDHVRIEKLLFDGIPDPLQGTLQPDLSRPGLGFEFKHADAGKYKV